MLEALAGNFLPAVPREGGADSRRGGRAVLPEPASLGMPQV